MPKKNPPPSENTVSFKMPDVVALNRALVDAYGKAMPLMEKFIEKHGHTKSLDDFLKRDFDPLNVRESYLAFLDSIVADPTRFFELQAKFVQDWTQLWQDSALKFMGQSPTQTGRARIEPDAGDRRFRAPEWQESALFDFIKQSYLLTCRWMDDAVRNTEGMEPRQKEKLAFVTRLFANALSPTNFVLTNPEVLNETLKTGGGNLVKGLENLIEDLGRGNGELKISTTDYDTFELGKNIAVTPGRVVFQNHLMQLIQYAPTTDKVFETPLLIIPPWINKYYILDLKSENSFIAWAVSQGHTVFTISWVNPTPKLAQKRFEDYMEEGVLTALDQIDTLCETKQTNVIGYCLGGTLLSCTLSTLTAKKKSTRVASATFLTTLLDFDKAGDLKIFLDKEQIDQIDKKMSEKGVFEGKEMQQTFSLLRANDLIWSFVVNNYLLGKEPFPFDLLYWNDDCTNMPAAMHSFYLRKMYQENALIQPGGISMRDVPVDLGTIAVPAYFLSTREDHIAPWTATYEGMKRLGGEKIFTLAASGHIAGVINPPAKKKYCYWVNDKIEETPEGWLEKAIQHEGSWWTHWQEWVKDFSGKKVSGRQPIQGVEAAPGSYVKVKN